jgi:hypothetical protein
MDVTAGTAEATVVVASANATTTTRAKVFGISSL